MPSGVPKTLLVVASAAVETGGMDVANLSLARRAAERGVATTLVSHRCSVALQGAANLRWIRVPRPFGSELLGWPLLKWAGSLAGIGTAGRKLANGGNCPLSDANWVHYVHAAYRPRSQRTGVYGFKLAEAHRRALSDERTALRRARVVIANSERTRRDLMEHLGVPGERIRTIYYGIDPARFRPVDDEVRHRTRRRLGLPDRPLAVFVGGLGDARKGFDTLFAAWQSLCKQSSWDADLVVIGTGAELPVWQRRAAAAAMNQRIHLLGFRDDVPELMPAMDFLIAPTRYEAYGLGVHEALCTGVPAIVSAGAGVAERYPPGLSSLLLEDPDSSSELAEKLTRLRHGIDVVRQRVLEYSRVLRGRTWDHMADDILRLLD